MSDEVVETIRELKEKLYVEALEKGRAEGRKEILDYIVTFEKDNIGCEDSSFCKDCKDMYMCSGMLQDAILAVKTEYSL